MSDRDELADVIGGWISDIPARPDFLEAADAILARWRLVPVEEEPPPVGQLFRNTITGSVFRYIGDGEYNPVMLGQDQARGAQLIYRYTLAMAGPLRPYTNDDGCACGRTDNHGPHED